MAKDSSFVLFVIIACLFNQIVTQNAPKINLFTLTHPKNSEKASIVCHAVNGDSPLTFNWNRDGKPVFNSDSIRIGQLQDSSILTIDSMLPSYNGNYSCGAKNTVGTDSKSIELVVEGPPSWIYKQENVKTHHNKDVILRCSSLAYPKPKVMWKKLENLAWKTISFERNINKLSDEEITIRKINKTAGGKYQCIISNGYEPNLWNEFDINIIVPAEFKEKNAVVSAKKGGVLELECSAEGDPPITIKWTKDSIALDHQRYQVTDQSTTNGLKSVLTVNSVEIKDNGLYLCLAENSFGKDERNIRVTIVEPPSAPQNLAVMQTWSRSVSVSWNKPSDARTSLFGYIIRYWKVTSFGTNDRLNEVNISSSIDSYIIRNLEPGTHYEANIMAINEVGQSQPSKTVSFDTGEEEPSTAPLDLQVIARGPTTIRVTWKPPPKGTLNGKLLGYYIGYRLADDYKTPHSYRTVETGDTNSTHEYLLILLKKSAKYSINVKAFNGAGSGPECNEITVETLSSDVPDSPRLHITSTTIDSITLRYSVSRSDFGKIQNVILHFKEEEDSGWREMDFFYDGKSSGDYTLTSLNSNTYYQVYLTASNENGASDPSYILRTKTARSQRDNYAIGSMFDSSSGQFSSYWDIVSVLSIIITVAIIIIVVVFAFVYVRKAQIEASTKPNFEFCVASQAGTLAYNKSAPVFGTTRRYVDSDNDIPLMHHGSIDNGIQYPVSYSNLPVENQRHSKAIDPKHVYDFSR